MSKTQKNKNIVFAPVSKPQEAFLNSNVKFTLYGGAAGAGKSAAVLGSILPIWRNPGTRAIIIRQTTKMLSGAGSLFDAAVQLFTKVDPKLQINTRDLILKFSSGAIVQFTYLDKPNDRLNLQGKEYSFMAFDECQQLSESNVLYALSRLRSTIVDYPVRAVATCNPDYDSFLRSWVEFALDERGIPIRYENGEYPVRYFVNTATGIKWFASKEEAEAIYGTKADNGVNSFKFIPATALDNKVLLKSNPDYLTTLKALPRVEMERLLLGSWYARESASGYFKREWVGYADHFNTEQCKRVRAWDLAFSEPSEVRPDVDATRGVLLSKDKYNFYTVENIVTARKRVHEVEQIIFNTARDDGKDVLISLPLDPGATAGAYCRDLARRLSEMGYTVKLTKPEKSKMQRFLPFASVAEAGFVKFVKSEWTDEAMNELERMDFTNNTHDDVADALSDAFYHLNKSMVLPSMKIPVFSSGNNHSLFNRGVSLPTVEIKLPQGNY